MIYYKPQVLKSSGELKQLSLINCPNKKISVVIIYFCKKNNLEDILNKLGWALLIAFGIMVLIIGVVLYQNNFTEEPEVEISTFYIFISLIFLGSGIYFRKLSKRI